MKLLGSTENKITKDKNGERVRHLEITEVVLVHCNIVNNGYEKDSRVLYTITINLKYQLQHGADRLHDFFCHHSFMLQGCLCQKFISSHS